MEILAIVIPLIIIGLVIFIFHNSWNIVAPLFHLPSLSYTQTLSLLFVVVILGYAFFFATQHNNK